METKPWYLSKTIIAAIIAALGGLLRLAGVDISDLSPQLIDQILSLASLIGGIGAIIGRIRASKGITAGRASSESLVVFCALLIRVCMALAVAVIVACCATATGDPARDARARATNQALTEAGKILGQVATSALLNAAQQEINGGTVDFAQAASAGLWSNAGAIIQGGSVERIVDAYSAGKLRQTAAVAANVFATESPQTAADSAKVTNAIAAVISTAAGAPPSL